MLLVDEEPLLVLEMLLGLETRRADISALMISDDPLSSMVFIAIVED